MLLKLLSISFLLLVVYSCSRKSVCYWAAPPRSLFFLIKENGKILSDDTLNKIKITYIENGNKMYILGLGQATDYYANKGILAAGYICDLSAVNNIKTFNLEYPNGDVDTLFADYIPPSVNTNCLC